MSHTDSFWSSMLGHGSGARAGLSADAARAMTRDEMQRLAFARAGQNVAGVVGESLIAAGVVFMREKRSPDLLPRDAELVGLVER